MKKFIICALTATFVLSFGAASAFAANRCGARRFVDSDNDGICDNRVNRDGFGPYFADDDNDGICDNRVNCGGFGRCGRFAAQNAK